MAINYINDLSVASEMDSDEDGITVESKTSNLSLEDRTSRHGLSETPARLIYTNDKGLLTIEQNVLSELSRIKKNISVIGICGLYRSGKSYLMNLIAGEKRGFTLGKTVHSETKGIWVWCKKHPKHEDEVLVLIDTEGLSDPKKGDPDHDNNLFCLTLLISSTLIINVKEVFNYDVLDKLAFISTLADKVKADENVKDDENVHMISVASPRLVMCIRDFYLQTEGTPDDYFEENLKPEQSTKQCPFDFNKTKMAITTYFPKRKCFTVAQPAIGHALRNIETLEDNAIDPTFFQDLDALKKYIYDRKPKYICNASKKPIDGADLATLITSYVNALSGKTPISCKTAYTQASEERNKRVLKEVMKLFKKEMEEGKKMTKKEELHNIFLKVFEKALAKYREKSFLYHQDEFEEIAKENMKSHLKLIEEQLKTRCKKLGAEKLCKMYDTMLKKNKHIYSSPDGYNHYEKDMETLKEQFFEEMKDYDKDDLWVAFEELKKKKNDERMEVYRVASEEKAHQQYRLAIETSNAMNEKFQKDLEIESQKKLSYVQKELDALRAENEKLSILLNKDKSFCSIM